MGRHVTIVMYHYVRDLERSRFPAIKGLSVERFRRQLDYIETRYTPIGAEYLLEALSSSTKDLPPNPILLTFDDGDTDHFTNVFPLSDARGIQGCFFPPAQAVLEHKVLDVNEIQFNLFLRPSPTPALCSTKCSPARTNFVWDPLVSGQEGSPTKRGTVFGPGPIACPARSGFHTSDPADEL